MKETNFKADGKTLFESALDHEYGRGVKADTAMAAELCLRAAQAGDPDAMCHLGYLMLFGYGLERSTKEAIAWLEKGVTAGGPQSVHRRNAGKLLAEIRKSPYPFRHEDARYPSFLESLSDYNSHARKHGFKTLSFSDGRLSGAAVDGVSLHYGDKSDRDHYLRLVTSDGSGIRKGCFSPFAQDFHIGYLGGGFINLIREMLVLGID